MAKVTNGHSFGLNIKETMICRMYALGKPEDDILYLHYGITGASTPKAKQKAKKELHKLMDKPGFEDCYRAIVNQETRGTYARSLRVFDRQVTELDPISDKQGWLANKAANDVVSKFHDIVMGVNSNEVTVKIEGMPTLGKPEDAEDESDGDGNG